MRRFYKLCPDCGKRMRRIMEEGIPGYGSMAYKCPCGAWWTYHEHNNSMERGWALKKGIPPKPEDYQ